MLTRIFDKITRLSIRFRWFVIAISLLVIAGGIYAMLTLNLEMLPNIDFPQTVVVAQWSDAESADQFLEEVTIPLEEALADVDGVVNLESTTSRNFAFVIARNEFGLNKDKIIEDIKSAVEATVLPDGIEAPQVINFGLGDLPVVVASASSGEISLDELKELIERELVPRLEQIEDIESVGVSGGQELPAVDESAVISPEAEEPSQEPQADQPVPLPLFLRQGAASFGVDIEFAHEITPQVLAHFVGAVTEEDMLQGLGMFQELLPSFPPETVALLPIEFVESLEAGEREMLDELASEQGGTGQYTATEVLSILSLELARLPVELVEGAGAFGYEIEYAQDIEPEFIQQLSAIGPQAIQALELLSDDNLRALQPQVIALLPMAFVDSLDAGLRAELDALAAEFGGAGQLAETAGELQSPAGTPEGESDQDQSRLPDILIQGASSFGVDIEYANDITPEFMQMIGSIGPQSLQILQLLTPDNLRAMQPEVIALIPAEYLETLDAALLEELDALAADFGGAGQLAAQAGSGQEDGEEQTFEDAPPLSGAWVTPGPDGSESPFQTAGDLLNNSFVPGAAALLNLLPNSPGVQDAAAMMSDLTPDVLAYLAENEAGFVSTLAPSILEMMSPEALTFLLETYPDDFDPAVAEYLAAIAAGTVEVFIPESSITRTDTNPGLVLSLYKRGDANTVEVAHRVFDELAEYESSNPNINFSFVFEQASFVEDSIRSVAQEGLLGALFAIIVILIFLSGRVGGKFKLSWRSTIVVGVSIPLSVFTAMLLMRVMPPTLGTWLNSLANETGNGPLTFIGRLFPATVTLNLMTLSGMTVAIGRVVDDSIVVLENSFRFIQKGGDQKEAVLNGTKEVAIAIFASTATTIAVFLPLGLMGGIIGAFFLPFGLTVTYALAASFVVAITVVPALTFILIKTDNIPDESESRMQRTYTPILEWALNHRIVTMAIATAIFVGSLFVLTQLPQSFIPEIGEPSINVTVQLENGTAMADTDALAREFEQAVSELSGVEKIQAEVGSGGGFEAFFGGGGISQNVANVSISAEDPEELAALTDEVRTLANEIFGEDNAVVSAASQTGFSGFSLIVASDTIEELEPFAEEIKQAIASVDIDEDGKPDIVNVSSNVDQAVVGGNGTIIRIDGRPAISFSGELETENTLGVTVAAKEAVATLANLPENAQITEGFESEQQTQGFQQMIQAIGISIGLVYIIMALTFKSLIHPLTILFSLPFALVGAAVALYLAGAVLSISAMIGLMMLVGIVVTNAIVLLELVQQLRKKGAVAYDALVQGGRTRLRPIWMTALAAVLALVPLALSQEGGAIIAAELATVVIGGLLVSTSLTLLVVPVVYSLFDQLSGRLRRNSS
jgi:HAE1 family hydrophobic/amphiphilic exporter-1